MDAVGVTWDCPVIRDAIAERLLLAAADVDGGASHRIVDRA